MKKEFFFAFAPMQTRDEPELLKAIPVIVSKMAANIFSKFNNTSPNIVDCWNTVGMKIDDDFNRTKSLRCMDRKEFSLNKISEFKNYFTKLGLTPAKYDYIDTSVKTQSIIKDLLVDKLQKGVIKQKSYSSSFYPDCLIDIAPEEVGV